jgi:4-amino-4-deoxy-L-arabinose transferase-like glycosyltransferase
MWKSKLGFLLVIEIFTWPFFVFLAIMGNAERQPFRVMGAIILAATCGTPGYIAGIYYLSRFYSAYPLPLWAFIAVAALFVVGYALHWKIYPQERGFLSF